MSFVLPDRLYTFLHDTLTTKDVLQAENFKDFENLIFIEGLIVRKE